MSPRYIRRIYWIFAYRTTQAWYGLTYTTELRVFFPWLITELCISLCQNTDTLDTKGVENNAEIIRK